jgi:hypothetical protein
MASASKKTPPSRADAKVHGSSHVEGLLRGGLDRSTERILSADTLEESSGPAITSNSPPPSPSNKRLGKKKADQKQPSQHHTDAPILVNPAPPTVDMPRSLRRSKPVEPSISKHSLPPLSAFSFAEILKEIEEKPDVRTSIDTIAEICGKSKMSLANEYGSHMPPHATQILGTGLLSLDGAMGEGLESVDEGVRLEVVEEVASDAASAGEEEERRGVWRGMGRRVGAGRPSIASSEGSATAVLGLTRGTESSPAVRHLQRLTRVS